MTNDRLLGIYLNDHLAGAIAGRELAKRCRSNNRGTALASYLATFLKELQADDAAVRETLLRIGVKPDVVKQAAGWLAEKVGRLKLNGQLIRYSDLSRLEEIEALCAGVELKRSLWRSLRRVAVSDVRLGAIDFDRLEERAEAQRTALEGFRMQAVARAFGR